MGKSTVPDIEAIVDTYIDTDIVGAIETKHEVSIKCKEYYMVHYFSIRMVDIVEFREMLMR